MSTIILRGTDKKLECTISLCEKINKMKEDGVDPKTPLNISGTVVELGEIRYAVKDGETDKEYLRESKREENGLAIEESNKKFNEEIKRYATGTLEVKLQFNLKVAKMYCFALTGEDIEEYKPALKSILIEELKKEKLVVNPTKYLRLFRIQEMEGSKDLTKIDVLVRQAPLRMMDNYLSQVYTTLSYTK